MSKKPDPIIEEIHEARRAIAKRFGGDIRKISQDARKRQQREARPVWHPEVAIKTAEPTNDAAQGHG